MFVFAAACTEPLKIDYSGVERLVQMDAFLDSADSIHVVHLGWSTADSYEPVTNRDGFCVTMYVNGEKVSETDSLFRDNQLQEVLYVKGCFSANDRVKLIGRIGDSTVESEVVAPSAAEIIGVDTTTVLNSKYFDVTIRDIPNQNNFYRFTIWNTWTATITEISPGNHESFEKLLGRIVRSEYEEKEVSGDEDPLISANLGINLQDEEVNGKTALNLFTDSSFRNGTYKARLKTDNDYRPIVGYSSSYVTEVPVDVIVRLHSLTSEAYRYLDDYQFEDSDESFLMVFPTAYPSNVKGGIGFVTAITSTDYVVKFPIWYFGGDFHRLDPIVVPR